MAQVLLEGQAVTDWDSFHDQCAAIFGFPPFYGRNMDAWIDCLTYLRDGDGMSGFHLGPDEPLVIEIVDVAVFKKQAPEVFDALVDCAAYVNLRYVEVGEAPPLHLVFR